MENLKITQGRGFQIEFPSGWKISVQFGTGQYHENRYKFSGYYGPNPSVKTDDGSFNCSFQWAELASGQYGSPNAEIAVWNTIVSEQERKENPDKQCCGWVSLAEHDDVAGWVGTVAIGMLIGKLAQYPSDAPYDKVTAELREILSRYNKE